NTVSSVTLTSAGAVATASVSGSPYTITPSAAVGSGLGNYTISYHNASIGLTMNKAAATVVVTPYTCPTTTYTGLSHTATYTLNGVNGETGAAVGTVDVSHTTHTPASTYESDYWFFTGSCNYNDIGNTTITDC